MLLWQCFFCIGFEVVILWVLWNPNLCIYINQVLRICLVQRDLRLTSFSAISGNKYCHGNTFLCFLGLQMFLGSWHSTPLHGLELISFLTIPGNNCCHSNTFTVYLTYKYFYRFFAFSTAAQTAADFGTTWQQHCFSFSWTYNKYFYGSLHSKPLLHG